MSSQFAFLSHPVIRAIIARHAEEAKQQEALARAFLRQRRIALTVTFIGERAVIRHAGVPLSSRIVERADARASIWLAIDCGVPVMEIYA